MKENPKSTEFTVIIPIKDSIMLKTWWKRFLDDNFWTLFFEGARKKGIIPYAFFTMYDKNIKWDKIFPNGIGFYVEDEKVIFTFFSAVPLKERKTKFEEAIKEWYLHRRDK